MTVTQFLDQVRVGAIIIEAAEYRNDALLTIERPLRIEDGAEALTAEAFHLGVFTMEQGWESALRAIKDALVA